MTDSVVAAEPRPDPESSSRRGWVIGVSAFLIAGAIGVAGGYAASLFGSDAGSSLASIPADADLTMTFDVQEFVEGDRLNRLIRAFTEPLAAAGHIESADVDLLQLIDEEIGAETGITIEEDVSPWIGEDITAGLWFDPILEDDPEVLVVFSMRDREAAEAFVDKVVATVDDVEITRTDYEGGSLYSGPEQGEPNAGFIWVGDDVLLISNRLSTVDRSLEARSGDAIDTTSGYEAVSAELPATPLIDFYVSGALFDKISAQLAGSPPAGTDATVMDFLDGTVGAGGSVSLTDDGLQFDSVYLNEGDNDLLSWGVFGGDALVQALPAETYGYLGFSLPEGYLDTFTEPLEDVDPAELEEVTRGFEEMFGVDLFDELIPSLGPSMVLAVVESSNGFIASQFDAPIGLLFALELSDPEPVRSVLSGLEGLAAEQGLEIVGDNPAVVRVDGEDVVAYSLGDNSLSIATSEDLLSGFLGNEGGVTDNPLYQELNEALPGSTMNMFFDLQAIFDELPIPADERAVLAPLIGFGAATEVETGLVRASALLRIDY